MTADGVPVAWPWLGHVIEVASLGLFGWCWLEARRTDGRLHLELLVAVVYGWLLEVLDMWVFGSYHYGGVTWWWAGDVPVYIPLLWAAILHSSMALSDRTSLPLWARPFLDGLLAVLIDLAIDAIAIRVGLWHWKIPINEGWFGVPAGNLCAWMWVAAWYGGFTRFVRERIERRGEPIWHYGLIPLFAYAGLFSSLFVAGAIGTLCGLETPNERLWLFAGHVLAFLLIVGYAPSNKPALHGSGHVPRSLSWSRWLMHGGFFVILCASSVWRHVPALIAVSGSAMLIEWWTQHTCEDLHPYQRKTLYDYIQQSPR